MDSHEAASKTTLMWGELLYDIMSKREQIEFTRKQQVWVIDDDDPKVYAGWVAGVSHTKDNNPECTIELYDEEWRTVYPKWDIFESEQEAKATLTKLKSAIDRN